MSSVADTSLGARSDAPPAGLNVSGPMAEVLACLKKYGQRLDLEIAVEVKMPLATVRERLCGLAAMGAVIICSLTRFEDGKPIEAWQCRVSGYVPPLAPGRKPKPTS